MADWYVAERNLDYLLTGDSKFLDLHVGDESELEPGHPQTRLLNEPESVLYFGSFLSALGCRLFYSTLSLMGSVEAHHLPNQLLVSGVLAALFAFVRPRFGVGAAAIAVVCIAAQPRFWANAQFNTKDIPYACLMAFTLLSSRRALLHRDGRWVAAAAVLLGLAAATRPNAALIPLIIALWVPFAYADARREPTTRAQRSSFVAALCATPIFFVLGYAAFWPYLWQQPVATLDYFVRHSAGVALKGSPGVQWDTLRLFLAVQPPAVLLFGGIGIIAAAVNIWRRHHREASALLLLWLLLPIVRVCLPRMYNFDGVRHFIGYAIPLGALCGIGVVQSFRWLTRQLSRIASFKPTWTRATASTLLALPFLSWSYSMVQLHPYEVVYFNFLVGGTRGAQSQWPDATDYWGSSYRKGIEWLNENAKPNAAVVVPIAGHVVGSVRHMWVRDDLLILLPENQGTITVDQYRQATADAGPRPLYAMYMTRRSWYNWLVRRIDKRWPLRHRIDVGGATILEIRANDPIAEGREGAAY